MSEAVRRCYLGWKCDAKYNILDILHVCMPPLIFTTACENIKCLILRREKIVGQ